MIRTSRAVIDELVGFGVEFEREADGSLAYTREGAHSAPRICCHADVTGREITTKLLARGLENVTLLENVEMTDILEAGEGNGRRCAGVVCRRTRRVGDSDEGPVEATGEAFELRAGAVVWATGGIGGTYERSTNYRCLTGDACRIALEHGIELEHMDYVQIHPTGLFSPQPGRTFLISESCRGEGAILLNAAGERFTDELQPRDVVAAAIREQMKQDGTEHEWLSFAPVERDVVTGHFANIRARCLEDGRDILEEPIPVTPTQHYFMGGVWVDKDGRTSMPELYAAGETACNGVHGKNRLASNSLLESLVWGRRAAWYMRTGKSLAVEQAGEPALDGRHRALSADTLAIDDLARAAGTQAVEE